MRERVNLVPQDQFVAVWNASNTVADAASRVAALVGKTVPGWAVLSRAAELRMAGIELQRLLPPTPRTGTASAGQSVG